MRDAPLSRGIWPLRRLAAFSSGAWNPQFQNALRLDIQKRQGARWTNRNATGSSERRLPVQGCARRQGFLPAAAAFAKTVLMVSRTCVGAFFLTSNNSVATCDE
ncbi:hypothetical protein L914_15264 [Phytophthora nicotianae]|uniref:Uncharacterized protein n=3 Tax=Phytophthora nicotianae TaxID=4792 RepID=V9EHF8_PHYNI|nr:hypothetical protein F443_15854 [Phytophthora nicotianae P1569]ETL32029.1 hypothetical protein L916_15305 [Phytophthora nicotianae]ETM38429.1 hypothetical protein L914_15264 [Phytophthora nicotianae]ETO67168.1 hypothetical protein F444_15835 [Phytophthora nicotianae P1976]